MIGTIDIAINAKNPSMPLYPMRAFVNSPSSIRIVNVPKRIGKWSIDAVSLIVVYPDGTTQSTSCVLTGGVWTGTVEGTQTSGTSENGYTVLADGTDENGNEVTGYVLGKGDVEILYADGTLSPDAARYYVKLLSAQVTEPNEGDMWPTNGSYAIWQNGTAHQLGVGMNQVSAYVNSNLSGYLQLSGGTLSGTLGAQNIYGNQFTSNSDCQTGGGQMYTSFGNNGILMGRSPDLLRILWPFDKSFGNDQTFATQEWVLQQLAALQTRITALENN